MQGVSNDVERRDFLQLAGGGLAAIFSSPVLGAKRTLPIQPVDEVTLQVVVVAATFGPFLPNQTLHGLRIERNAGRSEPRMSRQSIPAMPCRAAKPDTARLLPRLITSSTTKSRPALKAGGVQSASPARLSLRH